MVKNNIIFVETTQSWPNKFSANNTKVEFIAKGLFYNADSIVIVNSLKGENEQKCLSRLTVKDFIYYNYPKKFGFIFSKYLNLYLFNQILKENFKKDSNNVIIIGGPYFLVFLLIILISKLRGYKIGVTLSEWAVGIKTLSVLKRINYFFYDYFFGYFVDFIFPISTFLSEKCKKFDKKTLIIPILADYSITFNRNEIEIKNYFLYCASLDYLNSLNLVIESFHIHVSKGYTHKLVLVLSGSILQINEVKEKINKLGLSNLIDIFSQVKYEDLINLYNQAIALLIPLENNIQDRARFSQKIAEYLSSARPIVTGCVGDIPLYLKDQESAYIVTDFSPFAYSEIMSRIVLNIEEANRIGLKGRKVGECKFNYLQNGEKIHRFLLKQFE